MDVRVTLIDPLLTIHKSCNDKCFPACCTYKPPNSEVLGLRMARIGQMERFISIGPVQPRKVVHLERWTDFFETFPNRSIQFQTEISGNFGWKDLALVSLSSRKEDLHYSVSKFFYLNHKRMQNHVISEKKSHYSKCFWAENTSLRFCGYFCQTTTIKESMKKTLQLIWPLKCDCLQIFTPV